MSSRSKLLWRSGVILIGFVWSVVLWHQQVVTEVSARLDQQSIVQSAVNQSNQHSDKKIGAVQDDLKGVKTDIHGIQADVQGVKNAVSQSTSTLSESIGKVGKPAPPELAKLQFTIADDSTTNLPVLERDIPKDKDGNVSVEVTFTNTSDVSADTVDVWLVICTLCSFVTEPLGFDKPKGISEQMRHKSIPVLNPGTTFEKTTLVIKPPNVPFDGLEVGFRYSCKTCGKPLEPQKIRLNVISAGQNNPG